MNINLDMVLMIQLIQCVHAELKLKLLNLKLLNVLLYGYQKNKPKSFNQSILKNVISYIKATAWFDKPLISSKQ